MEGHVRNHGGPPGQLHEQELRHLQQEESQAPQQLSDVSDLPQDTLSEQSFRQELLAQQEATQDDPVIDPAIAQGGGCSVVGADGGPQILREVESDRAVLQKTLDRCFLRSFLLPVVSTE